MNITDGKTHVISSVIRRTGSDPTWTDERVTKVEAYRRCEVLNRKYGEEHIWTPALIVAQTLKGHPIAVPDKVCPITGQYEGPG